MTVSRVAATSRVSPVPVATMTEPPVTKASIPPAPNCWYMPSHSARTGETGGRGDDRHERESALSQGAEVADEAGVGLLVELFRGRARPDESVEPRHGAARDGHEEEGSDGRRVRGRVEVDRRRHDLGTREEDGAVEKAEADEELDAVDVVAGLQQQPDGEERRDGRVGEQDQDPLGAGPEPEELGRAA